MTSEVFTTNILTIGYLTSVKQDESCLPEGPMFLNPTSLANAFHLEVIEKKPESFKIGCLKVIRSLFPEATNPNPLHAGFGNRINDVAAYQAVGIPISRNFSINKNGELRHDKSLENQDISASSSYGKVTDIVNHIFPKL